MKNDNLEIWENIFKDNEWGKYPSVAVIKFIAKNFYSVPNRKEIKILEIGSGTGANLWFCAREGFSVYGIDGSETAVNRMITRFKEEKLSSNIVGTSVGDYFDKLDDIENNSFDAIIDVESLYCNSFNKSKKIVEKVFDKLKVGGVMFSLTFADGTYGVEGDEIDYHAVLPIEGPMANMGFTRYTTKDDIEKIYKLTNNEISNIERQDLNFSNGKILKEWIIELKKV
jgi:SAM-dependent methyltransferase